MVAIWSVFYVYLQLAVGFRAFAFFYAQLLDSHASPNICSNTSTFEKVFWYTTTTIRASTGLLKNHNRNISRASRPL